MANTNLNIEITRKRTVPTFSKPHKMLADQAGHIKTKLVDCLESCHRDYPELRVLLEEYIQFQNAADAITGQDKLIESEPLRHGSKSAEWNAGYEAGRRGTSIDDCPFAFQGDRRADWLQGHLAATQDIQNEV